MGPIIVAVWRLPGGDPEGKRMDRQLRRDCAARVQALDIPTPFDLEEFCRRFGAARGRPVRLLPAALPPGSPCGLWVSTDRVDYVFYEQHTSRLHREHIVLHEIGHLLCEHEATPVMGDEETRLVLPSLDPGMVQRVLGRTHYSAVEERQAELIASLVLEQVSTWTAEETAPVAPGAAGLVSRLENSLQPRGRRSPHA